MEQDLVSIISPVYNGEKYISYFFESVLKQTYSKIELAVIDDGSIDNTERIVEQYEKKFAERDDYRLLYLRQEENKEQAAAINMGLKIFSGNFVMWMDSDDILFPEAIEKKFLFWKNMQILISF